MVEIDHFIQCCQNGWIIGSIFDCNQIVWIQNWLGCRFVYQRRGGTVLPMNWGRGEDQYLSIIRTISNTTDELFSVVGVDGDVSSRRPASIVNDPIVFSAQSVDNSQLLLGCQLQFEFTVKFQTNELNASLRFSSRGHFWLKCSGLAPIIIMPLDGSGVAFQSITPGPNQSWTSTNQRPKRLQESPKESEKKSWVTVNPALGRRLKVKFRNMPQYSAI